VSARLWNHAGVVYRMPDYRTSARLIADARTAPPQSSIEAQVDALPLWIGIIAACLHSPDLTLPADPAEAEGVLLEAGWGLSDILSAGAACLTEVTSRMFVASDGAIKHRDFSTPRTGAGLSTTS
jgi:hypothetical protein